MTTCGFTQSEDSVGSGKQNTRKENATLLRTLCHSDEQIDFQWFGKMAKGSAVIKTEARQRRQLSTFHKLPISEDGCCTA